MGHEDRVQTEKLQIKYQGGRIIPATFFIYDEGSSNLNVYVGEDEMIHFTDWSGADSVLPFSKGGTAPILLMTRNSSGNGNIFSYALPAGYKYFIVWANHNQAYTMYYSVGNMSLVKESRSSLSIFIFSSDTTDGTAKTVSIRTWYNDSGPFSYFHAFAIFQYT